MTLLRSMRLWSKSAPLGWDRVKVSENLGATSVASVAPVDTSLLLNLASVLLQSFMNGWSKLVRSLAKNQHTETKRAAI